MIQALYVVDHDPEETSAYGTPRPPFRTAVGDKEDLVIAARAATGGQELTPGLVRQLAADYLQLRERAVLAERQLAASQGVALGIQSLYETELSERVRIVSLASDLSGQLAYVSKLLVALSAENLRLRHRLG